MYACAHDIWHAPLLPLTHAHIPNQATWFFLAAYMYMSRWLYRRFPTTCFIWGTYTSFLYNWQSLYHCILQERRCMLPQSGSCTTSTTLSPPQSGPWASSSTTCYWVTSPLRLRLRSWPATSTSTYSSLRVHLHTMCILSGRHFYAVHTCTKCVYLGKIYW